jgi:hypothetical protein
MVVTVLLYEFFASRSDAPLQPRAVAEPTAIHAMAHYRPASGTFASTPLIGRVLFAHEPIVGAIVYVQDPPPGRGLDRPKSVQLVIERLQYERPIYVAQRGDSLTVINRDSSLHTVRFKVEGRAYSSQPVPLSATEQPLRLPPAGLYELKCANHPTESTWLLVLEHPYISQTDSAGRFSLPEVPAEPLHIAALAAQRGQLFQGNAIAHPANHHLEAEIELLTPIRVGSIAKEEHEP